LLLIEQRFGNFAILKLLLCQLKRQFFAFIILSLKVPVTEPGRLQITSVCLAKFPLLSLGRLPSARDRF
jgi:hypothetical protein